jgi:two-component system, sensor histidine kinase YesM
LDESIIACSSPPSSFKIYKKASIIHELSKFDNIRLSVVYNIGEGGVTPMKRRIAVKVFIISFFMVESIIVLLGYRYYRHSSDSLLDAQYEYASQITNKSNDYLKVTLEHIRNLFITVGADSRFQNGSGDEIVRWFNDSLLPNLPNVYNIHLLEQGKLTASTSYVQWALLDTPFLAKEIERIKLGGTVYWIGPYFSLPSNYTVTAAMKLPSAEGEKIILLDLYLARLYDSMLPQSPNQISGEFVLLDASHQPVFGRLPYAQYYVFDKAYRLFGIEPEWFQGSWRQSERITESGQNLVLTRATNPIIGWDVVWILDKTALLRPLQETVSFTWALGLISLLLSIGMSYIISTMISRPIRSIAGSMQAVSDGQLDTTIRMKRQDELGLLSMHFNRMTARIRELIADLKRSEKEKQLSDFLALQAQMKPHFLFNTLNTISMAARTGEYGKVDQLISSLTTQLDYSLRSSPGPVTLREEISALESYVHLMNIRYPDKFTFHMDLDPLTLEMQLPKFVLQPLVENSIFHGLITEDQDGVLFVGTTSGADGWDIMIEDNGRGMTAQTKAELEERLSRPAFWGDRPVEDTAGNHSHGNSHGHGIGLVNVHRRLQMMFGDRYRLQIESAPGEGTRLLIRVGVESDEAHYDRG